MQKKVYERNNTELFLDAAESILSLFKGTNSLEFWPEIAAKLKECYSYEADSADSKSNRKFGTAKHSPEVITPPLH